MSEANRKRFSGLTVEIIRAVVIVALAVPGTIWTARSLLADQQEKIAVQQSQLDALRSSSIPRGEVEAQLSAIQKQLESMQADVRELRRSVDRQHQ